MIEFIRSMKETQLLQLKAQRQKVEENKPSLVAQKLALKKAETDAKILQIDTAYEAFKQERLKALEEDIAMKRAEFNAVLQNKANEIAKYKDTLNAQMQILAQSEAEAEVQKDLNAYDAEISAIEKELEK